MPWGPAGGSGGGSSFVPGPLQNLFGDTTGDVLTSTITSPATNRATAESVRDTYAAANTAWLAQYDVNARFAIFLYYLDGSGNSILQPQVRISGEWADTTSLTAFRGIDGAGLTFGGLDDFELVMVGPNGTPMHSGIRRTGGGTGSFEADETFVFPKDSIQVGYASVISAFGSLIKTRSFITGRTFLYPFQYYDNVTGSERVVELRFSGETMRVEQPEFDTPLPRTGTVTIPAVDTTAIFSIELRTNPNDQIDHLRFRATIEGQTEPFFYWPNKASFDNGIGNSVIADAQGMLDIDFLDSPMVLLDGVNVLIDYTYDNGSILGNSSNQPYLGISETVISLEPLARLSDIQQAMNSITAFGIQGQSRSVPEGTTLSGSRTFTFSIDDPTAIQGTGTLAQDGTTLTSTVSPTIFMFDQAITSVTLGSGQSTTFTLSFTTTGGQTISRSFRISSTPPEEMMYWGTQTSATASDFNFEADGVQQADIASTNIITIGTYTGSQHIAIAQPTSEPDIQSIILDGLNQIGAFTKNVGAVTISGEGYDVWISDNALSGLSGATMEVRR